jgi:hypothetical protein
MANQAKITIRVRHNRTGTSVQYSTTGRYFALTTAGFQRDLTGLPLLTTATTAAFWEAVIAQVTADLEANPTPP